MDMAAAQWLLCLACVLAVANSLRNGAKKPFLRKVNQVQRQLGHHSHSKDRILSPSWSRLRMSDESNTEDGTMEEMELPPGVERLELNDELKASFMSYAMSTILGRALPDARDGLKPVHRRVLYAMHGLGLLPSSTYRKCARVVGEVLGKYHPHGDMSVYDALVRMAQDFVMLHTLVAGHGNFGSVDNDPAAAMRYTEAKLSSADQCN